MMKIRNPQYNALGTIDCEVNFHGIDWLPFTASPDDVEDHGRAIHALAEAMGPMAYVPPDPVPSPAEVVAGLPEIEWPGV